MRLSPFAAALLLCSCGGEPPSSSKEAAAPAKVDPAVIIREPTWTRRPTPEEIAALRPAAAADLELSAVAGLWCIAQGDGAVADCQVEWQDPRGMGFGEAALKAAPLFRMATADRHGLVDGRPVQVQVTWPRPDEAMNRG